MSHRSFTPRHRDTHPSIEPLEARIAPAGVVLTTYDPITGALTITGDGEANALTISKTGANSYRIEGVDTAGALPTTIDGEAFQDVGKITSITVDMGGGDDFLTMTDVKKLKNLDFTGGAGHDTFEAENLTTKGSVNFDLGDGNDVVRFTGIAAVIGENLTFSENAGGSRVEFLAESNTVRQALGFVGGDGNDGLFLGQDSSLRVGRGVKVLGGSAGNDYVELDRGSVVSLGKNAEDGLSFEFEGSGSDADRVLVGGERVNLIGGIRIVGSDDTVTGDQFVIGARTETGLPSWDGSPSTSLKIGKDKDGISVSVDGLAGDDSLSLEASSGVLLGGLIYAAGEGNNEFRIAHSDKLTIGRIAAGDFTAGRSIIYTGGAGNDVVDLKTFQFMNFLGFVDVNAGGGENQLNLDAQNLLKIGKASVHGRSILFQGGAGEDSVNLHSRKISVSGYVDVVAHGGDDVLKILSMSASFGTSQNPFSIEFDSGAGDDRFELVTENLVASGHVHMRSTFGAGSAEDNDHFSIDATSFKALGVSVGGSKGDDTFEMNVERLMVSRFEYRSLGGNDSLAIHADGQVKNFECFFEDGSVTPNHGQSEVTITSLSQKPGALVLGHPTSTPESQVELSVSFVATGEDGIGALTLQNITFANRLTIVTGAGDNTVSLDNIQASYGLGIHTGDGADVVEIERGPGAGPSKITKLAEINLGAGDDIVRIGSSTESPTDHRVRFLGGLELIGGEGTDSRNADLETANEIVGTPVIEIEEQDA